MKKYLFIAPLIWCAVCFMSFETQAQVPHTFIQAQKVYKYGKLQYNAGIRCAFDSRNNTAQMYKQDGSRIQKDGTLIVINAKGKMMGRTAYRGGQKMTSKVRLPKQRGSYYVIAVSSNKTHYYVGRCPVK